MRFCSQCSAAYLPRSINLVQVIVFSIKPFMQRANFGSTGVEGHDLTILPSARDRRQKDTGEGGAR